MTGEGGLESVNFFHKESGGRGAGGGGLGLVIFFHKESKSKKKNFFFFWRGGGVRRGGGGVDGWTDEQAQTNLPLQLRSWRHNNALMYKFCP